MIFLVINNNVDNVLSFYEKNGKILKAYSSNDITLEEYVKENNITEYKLYSLKEYTQLKQDYYKKTLVDVSPTLITEDDYYEMLECLPPLEYTNIANILQRFCMSEFYVGNITSQYAKCKIAGEWYFLTKKVIFKDETTYITLKDFELAFNTN